MAEIQALRYLGRDNVDDTVIDQLARRLSAGDRRQLMGDIRFAPAWIGAIFRRLAPEGDIARSRHRVPVTPTR